MPLPCMCILTVADLRVMRPGSRKNFSKHYFGSVLCSFWEILGLAELFWLMF
ncbi:hypothetical protein M438DRAFT_349990 [Aureobasidium pullulans EXF-150]|uniref:Uncharacterized protein n=1 Tax=Aureobasidium pullulans EXF-150 TaxID=1043002 RepID=A0A074X0U0_AURPU|nr:uncharacterized protein M438DRAFT_349990 [Aureobasidium pullulans EXF-150]KEQ79028.1 hypothetical protein M438DRAFT_349990 [Aureobasidium pullulans EXF-150]